METQIFLAASCYQVLLHIILVQEILALTGGGKTREYTETRPDGTTVTYTIDVEEEVIEVSDDNLT